MATTDVNSIPDPQDAIIEMAQINIDSTEAPQAPNEIMNGEKGSLQLKTCLELHKAALKGDWETAKYLLEQGPRSILSATAAGVVEIAKIILTKNSSLMTIRGAENVTPLYMAALFAQRDMASFLYGKDDTKKALTVEDRKAIFLTYIRTGFYDLALNLLKDHPELAVVRDMNCDTALHVLARMPSTFARKDRGLLEGLISSFPGMKIMTHKKDSKSNQALQLVSCLWEEILKRDDLELTSLLGKPSQLSFDAAKLGNFEFLAELIGYYPDLAYELDNNNHTIFHVAVLHRHAKIFKLIYHTAFAKELMVTFEDNKQNNILHLAAKYPHASQVTNVSGAALQMQKELLWFKEVGQIVQPSFREKKNSESKTPQEIFSEEHEILLRSGELWMKKTAESCMLVATLITTIMFATALSVPGGPHAEETPAAQEQREEPANGSKDEESGENSGQEEDSDENSGQKESSEDPGDEEEAGEDRIMRTVNCREYELEPISEKVPYFPARVTVRSSWEVFDRIRAILARMRHGERDFGDTCFVSFKNRTKWKKSFWGRDALL
ncbi:uncharacterized protein LOC116109525 [Pistacia vera]|uniref:uncharacterized protein LOC116109525 n=1 Tax=Pistacia vera TaxID=55513 RepID=UPI001263BF83|nr:uncharacterized protein LOC116109525 [Pistacia vera]